MKQKLLENGYFRVVPTDDNIFFKIIQNEDTCEPLFKLYVTHMQADHEYTIFNANFKTKIGNFNIKSDNENMSLISEIEKYFYNFYLTLKDVIEVNETHSH